MNVNVTEQQIELLYLFSPVASWVYAGFCYFISPENTALRTCLNVSFDSTQTVRKPW